MKNAKEQIESSSYVISNPESHKGHFNKLFNNDNPIRIEIGMGKGTFIYNHALKNFLAYF